MSTKRPPLVNNEIYHVIIRGVADSSIFKDESDYFRVIFSLYEFNTTSSIEIRKRRESRKLLKISGGMSSATKRDLLVEILAFCLMPNHIHLLLKQVKDDGISLFMRKLGTGYVGYFNKKYGRTGHLFQSRFQAIHIENDTQLKVVFTYIHTNPISLIENKWKTKGASNIKEVIRFIEEEYKWSSYQDYIGKKNFPSVTSRDFLLESIGGESMCKEMVDDWIKGKRVKGFTTA